MAHGNRKSMVVDQIEADVAIPNGTESLFSFIATAHELKTHGDQVCDWELNKFLLRFLCFS